MVGLLELPLELFYEITGYIDSGQDWKSLAAVDRCFNFLAIKRFWAELDRDKRYRILMWACASGSERALCRVLESGLTTNVNLQVLGEHELQDQTPEFYLGQLSQENLGPADRHHDFLPYMDDIHQFITGLYCWRSCWKPIHVAVRHGQKHMVEILLHYGAWIDEPSQNYCLCSRPSMGVAHYIPKYTALHLALCTGQEEIAQLLLSNGASLYVDQNVRRDENSYSPDRGRITALHFCAIHGSLSTAKTILQEEEHETVIDERDEFGWSAILYAYRHFKNDVFDYLLAKGAGTQVSKMEYHWNSDSFDPTASELLHQACLEGRWEIVAKLVQHGSGPSKPDNEGRPPIILCLESFYYPRQYRRELDKAAVSKMVEAIKICGMHYNSQRETLLDAMKIALRWQIPGLVYLLLDAGMDISTMIEREEVGWEPRPAFPMARLGEPGFDEECYLDTGQYAHQQNLLDFACYRSGPSPELQELITLLFTRGCMNSEETGSYITTLKNLCCGAGYANYDDPKMQEHARSEERKCAQLICARFVITLRSRPAALRLPLHLLYMCFERGQYGILAELAKVFNFSDTECNEQELRYFFDMLTSTWWWELDGPLISSRLRCVEFLFQLGGSEAILHSTTTFKTLCFHTLSFDGGEEAVMAYLDCGGWYHFNPVASTPLFHAIHNGRPQFAKRLLDLGANPNKLLPFDPSIPHSSPNEVWHHNSGDDVGVLRVLLERGGNPFQDEHHGIGFPFGEPLEKGHKLEFFRELCRLTINYDTDDANLFEILDLACEYGRYDHIQAMRAFARPRVDAVICEKAALFLQKLLIHLTPIGDFCRYEYPQHVDQAIDTMRLILQLGGSNILTSSWRLKEGKQDFTALKVIKKLLTFPETDLSGTLGWGNAIQLFCISFCLEQRIKIDSESSPRSVTILGGKIDWTSKMRGSYGPPRNGEEEEKGGFMIAYDLGLEYLRDRRTNG
ncbi:hypothetical protein PG988_001313 [Apiospora saccharicola]